MQPVKIGLANPAARLTIPAALALGIEIEGGEITWPDSPNGFVVVLARSPQGQVAIYPLIASEGDRFIAPAQANQDFINRAQVAALEIAKGYVGVLTVTFDNELNVLQIHQGPHRAGLWTIEGARTSQFEQHLRALCDLPLGDPTMSAPMAMSQMVIGGEKPDLFRPYLHLFARDPGLRVHLYGVAVVPNAEIGHVTVLGENEESLRERADHAAGYLNGRIEE